MRYLKLFLLIFFSVFIPGLIEISPVERGVVTLSGVRSGLFVAMSEKGKLYGSVRTDLAGNETMKRGLNLN